MIVMFKFSPTSFVFGLQWTDGVFGIYVGPFAILIGRAAPDKTDS